MHPRTAPTYAHELSIAVEEIRKHGSEQHYKPGVISAYEYWKEAKARGLPSGQEDYEKVTRLDGSERLGCSDLQHVGELHESLMIRIDQFLGCGVAQLAGPKLRRMIRWVIGDDAARHAQ